MEQSADVTRLLKAWGAGNGGALDRLMPVVVDELRRLARYHLRGERRPGHTLQPTALVNEAYLRLVGQRRVSWQNRAHFFGIAAQMMRRILVDHARRRAAAKRGAGVTHVTLDERIVGRAAGDVDVVALDDALNALGSKDARLARLVEVRFFGGLTIDETADVLQISTATVSRDWKMARLWLRRELAAGGAA